MQIVADVLNMPIKVAASEQTCALGSAMAASVVAGVYEDIPAAQKAMGGGFEKEYHPDRASAEIYETLFRKYKDLGKLIEDNGIY
jgi:L-ribulokinase